VVATSAALDVAIEVPGYRPVFEPDVRGPREFRLRPGIVIEIEFDGLDLPEGPDAVVARASLTAVARPADRPAGWSRGGATRAQRDPHFRIGLAEPGRYSLALHFERPGHEGSAQIFDASGEPLDVRDADGQVFRVALDPELVRRKVESVLGER
jgi:hypothetical protein